MLDFGQSETSGKPENIKQILPAFPAFHRTEHGLISLGDSAELMRSNPANAVRGITA
jgi:hypothetical protein